MNDSISKTDYIGVTIFNIIGIAFLGYMLFLNFDNLTNGIIASLGICLIFFAQILTYWRYTNNDNTLS